MPGRRPPHISRPDDRRDVDEWEDERTGPHHPGWASGEELAALTKRVSKLEDEHAQAIADDLERYREKAEALEAERKRLLAAEREAQLGAEKARAAKREQRNADLKKMFLGGLIGSCFTIGTALLIRWLTR